MPKFSPAVSELLPHERYYLALGRFIQRYAGIEARLQTLLWRYAEVSPEVNIFGRKSGPSNELHQAPAQIAGN